MPVLFLGALILRRWIPYSSPIMFGVTLLLAFWYLPKLPVVLGWWLISVVQRWWKPSKPSFSAQRRAVLRGTLAVAAGYPYIIAAVGATQTTYAVRVQRRVLHFPDLPAAFAPLRIVQISDLHAGSFPDERRKSSAAQGAHSSSRRTVAGERSRCAGTIRRALCDRWD